METLCLLTLTLAVNALFLSTCSGDACRLNKCIIDPKRLRFWFKELELETREITLREGQSIALTCDGSCVGTNVNPYLSWYGPDRVRILTGDERSVSVERSLSGQFLRLQLTKVELVHSGIYTCRGWLGEDIGWKQRTIYVNIVTTRTTESTESPRSSSIILSSILRTTERTTARIEPASTQRSSIEAIIHRRTTNSSSYSTTRIEPVPTQGSSLETITHRRTIDRSSYTTPRIEPVPAQRSSVETTIYRRTTDRPSDTTPKEASTRDSVRQTTDTGACPSTDFTCFDGECIGLPYKCDGIPDCSDGSDERTEDCLPPPVCNEGQNPCRTPPGCFTEAERCDGVPHCTDGTDEDSCLLF